MFVDHTLIVLNNVAEVVAAAVVGLAHAHRVVGEVDIAVVALVGRVSDSCGRMR